MGGHTENTKHIDVTSLMVCNAWQEELGDSRLGYCEADIGSVSTYRQSADISIILKLEIRTGASLSSDQGK